MDWLKYFTDWYHTQEGFITFVVIIITAIVTVIATIAIPTLFKLAAKTPKYLVRLPQRGRVMFRNWRYWRKYHPIYKVDIGSIQCKRFNGRCKLTIQIMMSITNRDDLEKIMFSFENVGAKAYLHNIFDREMSCSFSWSEGERTLWLEPTQNIDGIHFAISGWVNTNPKIGEKASCKFEQLATVSMKGARPLKQKPLYLKVVLDEEPNNAET